MSWTLPNQRLDSGRRLHLHVRTGSKPPVELTFDKLDGDLLGVQVVLQDEAVIEREIFSGRLPAEAGLPVVDLTPWRGDERILDHVFEPIVGWQPFGTLSVQIARTGGLPSRECVVSALGVVLDQSILSWVFVSRILGSPRSLQSGAPTLPDSLDGVTEYSDYCRTDCSLFLPPPTFRRAVAGPGAATLPAPLTLGVRDLSAGRPSTPHLPRVSTLLLRPAGGVSGFARLWGPGDLHELRRVLAGDELGTSGG